MSALLYALTVLIWGTTFYAITFQVGSVPAEQSVFYRYALASAILWGIVQFRGGMPQFVPALHARFLLLGLFLFSLNYVLVYLATERIPSGLVSVLFSMTIIINALQLWLLFGERPERRLLIGAGLGVAGVSLLFVDEILAVRAEPAFLVGLGLGVLAAFSAASGNIVSQRLSLQGVSVIHANTWSMTYGSALTLGYILFSGEALQFETSLAYISALVYLAIFGSVIAFYMFLTLVSRIGAPRASYVAVLYSMLALLLSTFLEGMNWNLLMLVGVGLILLGNVFIIPARRSR